MGLVDLEVDGSAGTPRFAEWLGGDALPYLRAFQMRLAGGRGYD